MIAMTGTVQTYAWGSTTELPRFLGHEPDGTPQAELWFGAHASAPSRVGDQTLDQLIASDPVAVVGAESVDRFGPRLPYLLKVLAAARPLSLQAHPSREQAEQGYARESAAGLGSEQRAFADDWPKPEMMIALSTVDALCGFREAAQTYALFARLGVDEATRLVEPLSSGGPDALREVLARLLALTPADHPLVAQVVLAAAEEGSRDAEFEAFAGTATLLDGFFPGDPGILAALLLNRLRLDPGDALYLPAGNLHAYLGGSGVEIMANSDNTLRGGLTGKLIAVDVLLDVLDFTPARPPLVVPEADRPGVWRYPTPAPEFRLWRVEPGGATLPLPGSGSGRIVLAVEGEVSLRIGDRELTLDRGRAGFCLPGDEPAVTGSGVAFVAGPGIG